MNKKYKIVLEESWMGDTLLASNVVKNMTDMGYEIQLYHKWPFMSKFLSFFEINQQVIPAGYSRETFPVEDFEFRPYFHRLDLFANPLLDYAKSFDVEGLDLERASQFYCLQDKITNSYPPPPIPGPYITFEHDWQLRTHLDINYIVEELRKYLPVLAIGGDRFTDDPEPLIGSAVMLTYSTLHLGMVGGTTNLATFLGTKCIGSTDHLYRYYYADKSPEEFLEVFKPFPNHWADPKHIMNHPAITNDEFIQVVKNNLGI